MSEIDREKLREGIEAWSDINEEGLLALIILAEQYLEGKIGELASEEEIAEIIGDLQVTWDYERYNKNTKKKWIVEQGRVELQGEPAMGIAKALAGKVTKPVEEPEPNWEGKDLDYNSTLAHFAHQIGIPLWKAMAMMKYVKLKVPKPVEGTQSMGISGGSKNCNHEFDDEICCQCGALRPKPTGVTREELKDILDTFHDGIIEEQRREDDKHYTESINLLEESAINAILARLKGVE